MALIKFLANCSVYSQIWCYGWASHLTVSFFNALSLENWIEIWIYVVKREKECFVQW